MSKKIKDPVSGFSHLAGAIASIVGLIFLIIYIRKFIHNLRNQDKIEEGVDHSE